MPDKEKTLELWKRFLALNPSKEEFFTVYRKNRVLREQAGGRLLELELTNQELRHIVSWTFGDDLPDIRLKAGQKILSQRPSTDDLCYLISRLPELNKKAARMLLSEFSEVESKLEVPENIIKGLMLVASNVPRASREAGEALLSIASSHLHIRFVMRAVEELRDTAWKQLVLSRPSNDVWENIMLEGPDDLTQRAARHLLKATQARQTSSL